MAENTEKAVQETAPNLGKEAGTQADRNENSTPKKEVVIKFGKGLVEEPFISKNGKELVEVKIPNEDPKDSTPWASFVISPKLIHDNKFGKGVWMKLPEDGTTRVRKPVVIGLKQDGKKDWGYETRDVPNIELKEMMEFYKKRTRNSVLGEMRDKREELAVGTDKEAKGAKGATKDDGPAI